MFKNLKKNLSNLKNIRLTRFELILVSLVVLLNGGVIITSIVTNLYKFNIRFIQGYPSLFITLFIGLTIFFYYSYKEVMKKKVKASSLFLFLLFMGLMTAFVLNVDLLIEYYAKRGDFSQSDAYFTFFTILLAGLLIAKYDFPLVENYKEFFVALGQNIQKNLAIILSLVFIVAIAGLVNGAFVYAAAIVFILINTYLFKALLANTRK